MASSESDKKLATDLTAILVKPFPGATIEVGQSERWNRPCLTVRWGGFAALLPEERYHRLCKAIPEAFREQRLAGFVWLELAPKETLEAFLKHPRSEDILPREESIHASLKAAGFYEALGTSLNAEPMPECAGDFTITDQILANRKLTKAKRRDAKLIFIRHHTYCDCQILGTARAALDILYDEQA